ncbi:bifunctional phosphoribosyl-AMP cyclohydrolase/phosphoribosyl-ATP diphosphatase HisIE [Chryseobacterium sp. Bi04]|uniref:bifunctional phosphoribosyl-AMP cyclohydrolase/phosphoribosyl-ATP diphosphatase HisIE n=1 Tax=Chryseobacterium sp. Bi04 TaxID=2822345 RepID=UPI001D71F33E|nr:bifunctional phosphoribosyl-AMP cyclohydrolase/phosphoribosyl-ATP diphosphatase HisIE [Chryseobacterium sp. Bi04]CAH0204402.1 Phosphoribosyl-AMP cyclohydrolase [Chryseobacterium sp. Bi04]
MKIKFDKSNGLIPVVIQDHITLQVLMLGYMNEEALEKTKKEGVVTFFSRSKNRLWTKGEESGNFLTVKDISLDCDQDTILIKVIPRNVVCHTGSFSCFGNKDPKGFLYELEEKISQRIDSRSEESYTYSLYQRGINKVAQKVGEEAVELVIEAKDNNAELFKNEAADLIYHFLILLKAKGFTLEEIEDVLQNRNR